MMMVPSSVHGRLASGVRRVLTRPGLSSITREPYTCDRTLNGSRSPIATCRKACGVFGVQNRIGNVRCLSNRTSKGEKPGVQNDDTMHKEKQDEEISAEEEVLEDNNIVADLQAKVDKLEKELDEGKDKILRCYAEMENVRNRAKRDVESARVYANQKFAKSLLSVADNLERAMEAMPTDDGSDKLLDQSHQSLRSVVEGVAIVEKDLKKILESNGVVPFGKPGDTFDPKIHEAFLQIPTVEYAAGTIATVMQRGYYYKDRILRPAQVGTAKVVESKSNTLKK